MEKRTSNRHETEKSITCSYLTSQSYHDTFNGKLKNYCDSGMYTELQACFKKGTILLVKASNDPSDHLEPDAKEGFRSISLAEVKWSKKVSRQGAVWYGTGFQYLVS
jgi:hypothetical protein